MLKSMRLISALAFVLSAGAVAADEAIKVCEVIPTSDVESALGFKVANKRPGYRECDWVSADPRVFANGTAMKRYSHKISGTESFEQMKKMGYTGSITDDTPDLWCAKLTSPANQSGVPFVMCNAFSKGHYFQVRAVGAPMTREKAKALIAKMTARLP